MGIMGIIESYSSLSSKEQRIICTAAIANVPAGLSLLKVYFPDITPAEFQALREHCASKEFSI